MLCVVLFTLSSLLCGLAPSLGLLIFFRVLQGVGGGGLAPVEQAISWTRSLRKSGRGFRSLQHGHRTAPVIAALGLDHRQLELALDLLHQLPSDCSLILTNRLVSDLQSSP